MRLTVLVMVAACGASAPAPPPPEPPPPPPEPLVYQPLLWGMPEADVIAVLERAGMQPRNAPYSRRPGPARRGDPTLIADMMPLEPPPPPPRVWFVPRPGWIGEAWFVTEGGQLNAVTLSARLSAKRGHDEILRLIHRHGRPDDHRMTDMTTVRATWTRGGARLFAVASNGYVSIAYHNGM